MAENKLKTALREVVSTEFAEIPRNEREINHSFSDDFLRRIKQTKNQTPMLPYIMMHGPMTTMTIRFCRWFMLPVKVGRKLI